MVQRVTESFLKKVVNRLNVTLNQPLDPYTKLVDGTWKANPGNYHLDTSTDGTSLVRLTNLSGGTETILHRGTKGDLLERLHAFLQGIEVGILTEAARKNGKPLPFGVKMMNQIPEVMQVPQVEKLPFGKESDPNDSRS